MTPRDDRREPADLPRDAWLSEALRHAPDADATPPAELSALILRQARAAAAPTPRAATRPSTASPLQRLLAAWSWLARPPVAAGFASVMVATLVGVMWWDRPLDETLRRPEAPTSVTANAPATPQEPATRAAPFGDSSSQGVSPSQDEAKVTAAPDSPRATPEGRRITPAVGARAAKRELPQDRSPQPDDSRSRNLAIRENAAQAPAAAAAPGPTPAPTATAAPAAKSVQAEATAPAPQSALPPPSPAIAGRLREAEPGVAANDGRGAPPARDERLMQRAPAPQAFAKSAPPPVVGLTARRDQDTLGRASPLSGPIGAITVEPQRWTWQRGADPQPMTPAVQRWLQQLDSMAGSLWRAGEGGLAGGGGGRGVLQLRRDGALVATVRIDDNAAWFVPADPSQGGLMAPLQPGAAGALQTLLDDATP